MNETLKKRERLRSRKLIGALFEKGQSIKKFPFRLIFLKIRPASPLTIQVSFSVSKRNFKKAVTRNRIKRLMREVYRLEKKGLLDHLDFSYAFMITHIGKKEPIYGEVQEKIRELFSLFTEMQTQKKHA